MWSLRLASLTQLSRFIHVVAYIGTLFHLLLSSIPSYEYTTFYLSMYLCISSWIFGLSLLWGYYNASMIIHVQIFVWSISIHKSWIYSQKWNCLVIRQLCVSVFNLLNTCQTVFPCSCTILHFHQKCMNVAISSHP